MEPGSSLFSSGSPVLDSLLGGGFERGRVSTIYGPGGVGKTNLCLLAALSAAREGGRVAYIDTEGGHAVSRLAQFCDDAKVLSRVLFVQPVSFAEQEQIIEQLPFAVEKQGITLVVVDSISRLYRLEIGRSRAVYETNKALSVQVAALVRLARKTGVPVLLTNQVYSLMDGSDGVVMLGGEVLRYGSAGLVELQVLEEGVRRASVRKHRVAKIGASVLFRIVGDGVRAVDG